MSDDGTATSGFGWFAHPPAGSGDYVEPPVRDVELRVDEYAGPFWTSMSALGDDYEELHADLGISRQLYDDVMAWHSATLNAELDVDASFHVQQALLRRLADEVGADIAVPEPRTTRPRAVSLLRDDPRALPLPDALRDAVTAWRARAGGLEHATGNNDTAIFAWEDAGGALAQEVQALLGPGYSVNML